MHEHGNRTPNIECINNGEPHGLVKANERLVWDMSRFAEAVAFTSGKGSNQLFSIR